MPQTVPIHREIPLRRRVRREYQAGDQVGFVTKSFTRDDGTKYHPVIDVQTGEFICDCPDHRYRGSFCKHLQRAAAQLKEQIIPANLGQESPYCYICNGTENLYSIIHEDGKRAEGAHLCSACADELRALTEEPSVEGMRARVEALQSERAGMVAEDAFWNEMSELGLCNPKIAEIDDELASLWRRIMEADSQ